MKNGLVVDTISGDEYWFKGDVLHREDGPAINRQNLTQVWYIGGKLHREDGPAVMVKGSTPGYYLWGIRFTKEEFERKMNIQPMQRRII